MASIKNIATPDLGGATDVTVIEVLIKPGDKIQADMSIVTLESDKATLDVPSMDGGVVKEVKVKVGDKVSTGSVLITLETDAVETQTDQEKPAAPAQENKSAEKPAAVQSAAPPKAALPATAMPAPQVLTGTVQSNSDVHAGPGVRRLARELGVNLVQVMGTGPKQRILKEDVQAYVKNQLSQVQSGGMSLPSAPVIDFSKFGPIESQALSRIKKISGKNLQRNWMMIPHVTQFGEADITALEDFRKTQKDVLEKQK